MCCVFFIFDGWDFFALFSEINSIELKSSAHLAVKQQQWLKDTTDK